MHGYCSKCVNMHSFRRTDVEDFSVKCVKLVAFCILQMFTSTDVDALNLIYKIYIYINKNKKNM